MSSDKKSKLSPYPQHSTLKETKEWILVAAPIILVKLVKRVTIEPNVQLQEDKQIVAIFFLLKNNL